MMTKKQRISWIKYNKERNMFEVWFGYANIEWIYMPEGEYEKGSSLDYDVEVLEAYFQTGYFCQASAVDQDKDYIHWSMLREIDELMENGYIFMGMQEWK